MSPTPTVLTETETAALDRRYEGWIPVEVAATRLNVSTRTVRQWATEGKLERQERPRVRAKAEVLLNASEVERLAVTRSQELTALVPAIRTVEAAAPAIPATTCLELNAASSYTGLPSRYISRLIQRGLLHAHRFSGRYYISRRELDNL